MTKFKPGQKVFAHSSCDYDCIFYGDILSRTEKTVKIRVNGDIVIRKISTHADIEIIYPFGKYSMAPIFRADRVEA
jgi:hypothetical protein